MAGAARRLTEGFLPRVRQQRDVAKARALRGALTLPEVMLWQRLRVCELAKFRRQHPVGRYVLDFYCASAKVAIEVDGVAHDMGDRPARDDARDAWLSGQGVRVLRVPAGEVLRDVDGVAEGVLRVCLGR